jgi:amicoumacin kinase
MIPVPQPVLDTLSRAFGAQADLMSHFGGGREENDGVVYAYPYQDRRRLLKIMAIPEEGRQRGLLCLEERLRFMRFLGERGARIAFPQLSSQGKLYETISFAAHLWVGYSMEIMPGKTPHESASNPGLFRNWGEIVGRLHRLAREYPSWQASIGPVTGERFLTWREEWQSFYQWCKDEEVRGKWVEIKNRLEALPVTRRAFGFTHNDPHLWNLVADGEQVTLLDFDVANHHWFINDIAIACQSILFAQSGGLRHPVHQREKLEEFLGFFLEGYEREHHLSAEWLDCLDLFIAYRRILMFIVMYGWISSKPEMHTAWKQMILSEPDVVGHLTR